MKFNLLFQYIKKVFICNKIKKKENYWNLKTLKEVQTKKKFASSFDFNESFSERKAVTFDTFWGFEWDFYVFGSREVIFKAKNFKFWEWGFQSSTIYFEIRTPIYNMQ